MQKLLIYICITLLCAQCAQITPLTGGKKDDKAPKALQYKPENVSLNFNSKNIEIQFDEYIVLKDIANQFIITPQTKEQPTIQASGKKLKIAFNESLLPNTTYKLAFGNAITDLNESNSLQNFEYIFSTGSIIDTLSISGKVINAFDKKPSSQTLVGLYNANSPDSVVYKEKPLYITKTSDAGEYTFKHLPDSKFKIIAIKDQNKNLLYDGSLEQIAFNKNLVTTNEIPDINMLLFKEVPVKSFITKSQLVEPGKVQIIFNKPQVEFKNAIAKGAISYSFNNTKDTLNIYYANKFDTLLTYINYLSKKTDTVLIKIPSLNGPKRTKQDLKYTIQSNTNGSMPFFEIPELKLGFPAQSKNINSSKFFISDNTGAVPIPVDFTILKDTGYITSLKLQAVFKPETNYTLVILKNAFSKDTLRTNDSINFRFTTSAIEDYAQLNLKLLFPKKENYIVQLLNDKENIVNQQYVEFSLSGTVQKNVGYNNLLPGNYFIKVIEDANKNGVFDTGDYFLKKQPETIFNNSQPIKLLAGWEIENEWIVE